MTRAGLILDAALALRIDAGIVVCPACRARLGVEDDTPALVCASCAERYRVVDGIPALVPPASAFFDRVSEQTTGSYFSTLGENPVKRRLRRALPALGRDMGNGDPRLRDALGDGGLGDRGPEPNQGLAIGAGERPEGYATRFPEVEWLVTDIDAGYGPQLLADVQHLPVADGSMDVVVAEMVLEHVMDPKQAAHEIERVLRPGGLLYVTTPFTFPWHGIPIDFQRFTASGLIALFRTIDVQALGPGMGRFSALAYQLDASLVNSGRRRLVRRMLALLSRFAFGWLKLLDRPWGSAPPSRLLVAPGGLILLGTRRTEPRSDAETLALLRERFGTGP